MANPIYHADPEFYERPGETVHLEVDQHPTLFTVPALPWRGEALEPKPGIVGRLKAAGLLEPHVAATYHCVVCGKPTRSVEHLTCDYCARAQARDETAKARATIPQPSRPRIAIREGWESWTSEQPRSEDTSLERGHVRPYETRIG